MHAGVGAIPAKLVESGEPPDPASLARFDFLAVVRRDTVIQVIDLDVIVLHVLLRDMDRVRSTSPLGYAIMGLVRERAMSGYDVRRQFTSSPLGRYSDSPGAIYPALGRLERDGFVSGQVERGKTLRPRKLYRLTQAGKAAFAAWIQETPTSGDIIEHMSDWTLRLAFATNVLSRDAAIALLQAIEVACSDYLDELRAVRAGMPKREPFPRLALDHGIASYEATAAWAREGVRQLKHGKRT